MLVLASHILTAAMEFSGVGSFDNDPNPDIAQESAQGFEKALRKDIPLRMTSLSVNS